MNPKNHVFISYSRANKDVAQKLSNYFSQEKISVWIDQNGLELGTNWQKEIRKAIEHSFAIVFLASPEAANSEFVMAELQLAMRYHCPIYSLWVKGETWIDCVPLEMVHHQYIDCRNENFYDGFLMLKNKIREISPNTLSYSSSNHGSMSQLSPSQLELLNTFLANVYKEGITQKFHITTVGSKKQLMYSDYVIEVEISDNEIMGLARLGYVQVYASENTLMFTNKVLELKTGENK